MSREIIFFHLLNDSSGSPKVLIATIGAVAAKERGRARLYLGSSGDGILSRCGIPITRYWYHRSRFRIVTLFTYLFSQFILFCKLLTDRAISKDAVVFVNTLLPFGAALYGRLTGRKVIYHVHEISITPTPLKSLLTGIAKRTSNLNLYVSDAHMQALPIPGVPSRRVYNALDQDFLKSASASAYEHRRDGDFNVLMIASLRDYKGVPELVELAAGLIDRPDIRFLLVVNDEQADIDRYFVGKVLPANFAVYPRTPDPASFYRQASLLLNLSRVDQCVETFGLTILEAMAFGIPVIVPPVGGPAELVADGKQGFLIDSRDHEKLAERVRQLADDPALCARLSAAGGQQAAGFLPEVFAREIVAAIEAAIVTRD